MNGYGSTAGRVRARLTGRRGRLSARSRGRDQNRPVRFWIITMMLVLFGLSTLKLR
jgi:UDP-N-acetylmuramyl pentapeptide phosphotransferase/UDP-N-acetylglucosamine-1-phosphate transferase